MPIDMKNKTFEALRLSPFVSSLKALMEGECDLFPKGIFYNPIQYYFFSPKKQYYFFSHNSICFFCINKQFNKLNLYNYYYI